MKLYHEGLGQSWRKGTELHTHILKAHLDHILSCGIFFFTKKLIALREPDISTVAQRWLHALTKAQSFSRGSSVWIYHTLNICLNTHTQVYFGLQKWLIRAPWSQMHQCITVNLISNTTQSRTAHIYTSHNH